MGILLKENGYEFRTANKDDLYLLNNILRLSLGSWGYDEDFLDKYMKHFSVTEEYFNRALKIMIMMQSKNIIGFYSFSINNEQAIELDNFFLHPDYIGKGLGQKLWDHVINLAQRLGLKEFIGWADPKAEAFYLKMGCIKIGELKSPLMPNRFPPLLKYTI